MDKYEDTVFDDGTEPTVRRRLPYGADQQGRYPEAAEPCTDIGQENEDPKEDTMWFWVMVVVIITAIKQALAAPVQEPVGWHSKLYGFVYMAKQPHEFEIGSIFYLKDGTPAWRVESNCFQTALISMANLPHGTVFYTTPPAAQPAVPLTPEQINTLRQQYGVTSDGRGIKEFTYVVDFARAIEAKLKEKNHG